MKMPPSEQELMDALRAEYEDACRDAPLPAAGTVWWRATIRARADAARTAERPIAAWQGVAAAAVLGVVAGLGGAAWRGITALGRAGDLIEVLQTRRDDFAAASALVAAHGASVFLAIVACAIVAPIAVYLATDE